MNHLRKERIRQGLSQFELAKRSNISPADISKIENGTCITFPGWRKRLSEALGVPEEELFSKQDKNELN